MANKLRILLLSRYSGLGASSRMRLFQYVPFLERIGAQILISPFFDDAYLKELYSTRKRHFTTVAASYVRRACALLRARSCSVVWVEKEVFPFLPAGFEALLSHCGVPYIVDYDDAIFHTYDQHRSTWVRRALERKLDPLLNNATHVTVGNSYLEAYVRAHGASSVTRIPTVVDITRYNVSPEPYLDTTSTEFRIGWIGSPETTKYLHLVRDALRALSAERPIRLITIGAAPLPDYGVPLEQHAWDEQTEAQLLSSIHVGIMPLMDSPWERGKCGYKLIQYMACGRPVVASPVGVNQDIVTDRVGFLAHDTDAWLQALRLLASDIDRRRAYGAAARERVEREFTLQVTAPRIVELLCEAARSFPQSVR